MDENDIQRLTTSLLSAVVAEAPDLARRELAGAARTAADGLAANIAAIEADAEQQVKHAYVNGIGETPAGALATRRLFETVLSNLENARVAHAIVLAVARALEDPRRGGAR